MDNANLKRWKAFPYTIRTLTGWYAFCWYWYWYWSKNHSLEQVLVSHLNQQLHFRISSCRKTNCRWEARKEKILWMKSRVRWALVRFPGHHQCPTARGWGTWLSRLLCKKLKQNPSQLEKWTRITTSQWIRCVTRTRRHFVVRAKTTPVFLQKSALRPSIFLKQRKGNCDNADDPPP